MSAISKSTNVPYHQPCPHERGETASGYLPDYHPLTRQQVRHLLAFALRNGVQTAAGAQVRLGQAVPRNVCPHRLDCENMYRSCMVDSAFVEGVQRGHFSYRCRVTIYAALGI